MAFRLPLCRRSVLCGRLRVIGCLVGRLRGLVLVCRCRLIRTRRALWTRRSRIVWCRSTLRATTSVLAVLGSRRRRRGIPALQRGALGVGSIACGRRLMVPFCAVCVKRGRMPRWGLLGLYARRVRRLLTALRPLQGVARRETARSRGERCLRRRRPLPRLGCGLWALVGTVLRVWSWSSLRGSVATLIA